MTDILVALVVAGGIVTGMFLGLREMARHHADAAEPAGLFDCPRCDHRRPQAVCTCYGQCGRRNCLPATWNTIADLYPRSDVEYLRYINGWRQPTGGGQDA